MMTSTNDNHSHSDSDGHISGMFLAIGRLNHSCIPNAQQTFIPLQRNNKKYNNVKINTNTSQDNINNFNNNTSNNNDNRRSSSSCIGYEVLYATRDIMIGEEINDCYIELRQSSKDRRKELMSLYRFKCLCKICSINDDDDDKDDIGGEDDDKISKEMKKHKLREGIQIDDDRRRQRAMQLDEAIYEFLSMGEYNMAQDISIELIKLLEHTKSIGWG